MKNNISRRSFLRTAIAGGASLLAPLLACSEKPKRPNIVFFLVDDLGIKDLSCYGSVFHESPYIDKLASQGIKYTNAYSSHPVCGPSRSAIVTGKFPARIDLTRIGGGIPKSDTIWPKVLKKNGYSTYFVGKWHMGGPETIHENGFDINIAGNNNGQPANFYFPYKGEPSSQNVPGMEDGKPGDYLTDALANKAVKLLDKNGDKPFLLYFSYYNVHKPSVSVAQGKKEHVDYFEKKLETMPPSDMTLYEKEHGGHTVKSLRSQRNPEYAGQIKSLDDSVGRIMKKLEEIGEADNTIIIFTSDQGSMCTSKKFAVSSAWPYRYGKSFMFEGGIRVPFIVKWPGHMVTDSTNDTVTINTDIYPTIMDMLGLPQNKKQHQDGISLFKTFKGETIPFDRTFYWVYPYDHSELGHRASLAVRKGPYKLIYWPVIGTSELYNVEKDISESHDISKQQPEITSKLFKLLQDWKPAGKILSEYN